MNKRSGAEQFIRRGLAQFAGVAVCAALLSGCADQPPRGRMPAAVNPSSYQIKLPEPAADEAVIVINNNTTGIGNHAGMFIGGRLSDPAGNYVFRRSRNSDWKGTNLTDYVRFQMEDDGERIQVYRFTLVKPDFETIENRVKNFGRGMPLFCASDIQNQIAGVGPFGSIKSIGFTTPAALAQRLDALLKDSAAHGLCTWPDGGACNPSVSRP